MIDHHFQPQHCRYFGPENSLDICSIPGLWPIASLRHIVTKHVSMDCQKILPRRKITPAENQWLRSVFINANKHPAITYMKDVDHLLKKINKFESKYPHVQWTLAIPYMTTYVFMCVQAPAQGSLSCLSSDAETQGLSLA